MTSSKWLSPRRHAAAILLPALLMIEMLALGANGPVLAVAAATLEIAAAIVVIVLVRPEAAFWHRAWPVLLAMAALILWPAAGSLGLIAVPAGQHLAPDLARPGLARLFGAAAVLLAGACIGYRRGLMRVSIDWLMIFGVAQSLVGLAMREYDPEHVWGFDKGINLNRFTGTFLNANASGSLFGVLAVLAVGSWLAALRETPVEAGGTRTLRATLQPLLILLIGLGACAITASRTALALTIVTILAVGLADSHARTRLGKWVALALLGGVALLVATIGLDTLDRLDALGVDGIDRMRTWNHYLALATAQPLFGYGLQAFSEANAHGMLTPHDATTYWYINAAHNKLLTLLIEGGWPYLGLAMLVTALMAVAFVRNRKLQRNDPMLRAIGAAVLLMAGCSMVDIALDVPGLAALAIFLVALPWGRSLRIGTDRQRLSAAVLS